MLARQPETGMGYQVLELQDLPREARHAIVFNGTHIHEVTPGPLVLRERPDRDAEAAALRALQEPAERTPFRVLSRPEAEQARVLESRPSDDGPASEAPIEQSAAEERFLRFSAFPDDIRIQEDGSLTAGTYVTTYEDGMAHVRTGTDAVRRYALPNPEPAVHRYQLQPPQPIPVRRGRVQPAFGQPGGGTEVIFEDGAPAGTKRKQDEIPPE